MNAPTTFIKDYRLIQEDCRVDDLLDFTESITSFCNRLDSMKKPAIIGLVGKFGTGKSTMLHQVRQRRKEETWIDFDAWKYPDRKDLWEGFVLDFAEQLGGRKKALRKIESKGAKSKALDVVGAIATGLGQAIPGLGAIKPYMEVFKDSPAKRVFEIQRILSEIIAKHGKPICIIVEDIDRSGDAGTYFLETLRQFLNENSISSSVVVIVPIGNKNFNDSSDSYFKCLDYIDQFQPKLSGLSRFVDAVFASDAFVDKPSLGLFTPPLSAQNQKDLVISLLEDLLIHRKMTIRTLKTILRNAESDYVMQLGDGREPEWMVTLACEASKYLMSSLATDRSQFDELNAATKIPRHLLLAYFVFAMATGRTVLYEVDPNDASQTPKTLPFDIRLITRRTKLDIDEYPSRPWYFRHHSGGDEKEGICLCDFYLDY
ncbi:MAG TPA: P-loop NTPase fold protein [Candidatus Acidoferrum sp.]|nr:P-loop NTPase fold protein [Candidatus Acidoferrum sp.]